MGTVRTIEWKLLAPPGDADTQLRDALAHLGMDPKMDNGTIRARAPRDIAKNRWAADLAIELKPLGDGTLAMFHVEMTGTKHRDVLTEIARALGSEVFGYHEPVAPETLIPATRGMPAVVAGAWIRREALARASALQSQAVAEDLDDLSPAQFEVAMARRLEQEGYAEVGVVGGAGDLGADIQGVDAHGNRFIAQCKRYAAGRSVNSSEMQLFVGMVVHHHATRALYFTTGRFTAAARSLGVEHDIELFDRDRLPELVADEEVAAPRATLLAAIERDIRGEILANLVVGRVKPPTTANVAGVDLQDGRTGALLAGHLEKPRYFDPDDPLCTRLLRSYRGRTTRLWITGITDAGTPILSRRDAMAFEQRDVRDQALQTIGEMSTISVTVEEVEDDVAWGWTTVGPYFVRVLFDKKHLGVRDFYRMSEFLEAGHCYDALVVVVDRSTQILLARLKPET